MTLVLIVAALIGVGSIIEPTLEQKVCNLVCEKSDDGQKTQ